MIKKRFFIASSILVGAASAWASSANVPEAGPASESDRSSKNTFNSFDSAPAVGSAKDLEDFGSSESVARLDSGLMPLLRRLGGLSVESNLEEFRTTYSAQVKDFRGFPGSAYMGEQIEFRLGSLIEQASQASGRFWYLPPHAAEQQSRKRSFEGAVGSLASDLNRRSALKKEFDLDGWINFKVNFYPDHSEIVAELFGPDKGYKDPAFELGAEGLAAPSNGSMPLLATEKLFLGAMPTEEALFAGFLRIWARVSATSGHLSAVTWQSGDLVSIDMGFPQLTVGTRLVAGEVHVQRRHPRTGEVLQTLRFPKAQLEVIETQELSALARVTGLNKSLLSDAGADTSKLSLLRLLVWKDSGQIWDGKLNASAQENAVAGESLDSLDVQQGNTGIGFELKNLADHEPAGQDGARLKPVPQRRMLKVPGPQHLYVPQRYAQEESLGNDARGAEASTRPEDMATRTPAAIPGQESVLQPQGHEHAELPGVAPQLSQSYFDALAEPAGWVHHSSVFSAGQSWAILDTKPCPNKPCNRYSGFPSSVVNLVGGSLGFMVTPTAALDFDGALAFFSGGDVEGFELHLKALSVHPFSNFSGSRFSLFLGPEISLGNAKTVLYKKSLNHLGLVAGGSYSFGVAGIGKFVSSLGISLFDLFGGKFHYNIKISTESLASLPRELGLFFEFAQPQSRLSKLNLGVSWNIPVRRLSDLGMRPAAESDAIQQSP